MSGEMTIPQGYKQTEVGVIPKDWEVKPLKAVAGIRSGIAKNENASVSDPVLVHYLRVANVQDGFLDLTEMSKIEVSRKDVRHYSVLHGDVLMNEGGDLDKLGRGCMWRGEFSPCVHQNHVFVVRCGPGLSPQYLSSWTRAAPARRYFMIAGKQTTNLASISKTTLGQLWITLPPLHEQEAIAEALSDADALIESLEHLVAKKRQIKQGAMQDLLTGTKRLPGFSGGWTACQIRDIADVKTGPFGSSLHESDYVDDGVPIITVEHLGEAGVLHFNLPRVSNLDWNRLSAYTLQEGDIVFSRVGSVDRNALVRSLEAGWLFSGRLLRLRLNPSKAFAPFLSHYFHTDRFKQRVRSMAVGQTMASLNTRILNGIAIQIPLVPEQTAIATILSDLDADIAGLETKLTKARQLKQGMMQELLTGRIRLVPAGTHKSES